MRISVVSVIFALAISLTIEAVATECWQGSISAYYYTPSRTIFVGALIALGLVLIVLWGRTPIEDGAFNLAGLLAPVVAFVPTVETTEIRTCAFRGSLGDELAADATKAQLVTAASKESVQNNMLTYILVVGFTLIAIALFTHARHRREPHDPPSTLRVLREFWGPWLVAFILWIFGAVALAVDDGEWFRQNAHAPAAYTMFVFIAIGVLGIARDRWQGGNERIAGDRPSKPWALVYLGIALSMMLGFIVTFTLAAALGGEFRDHRTFILEAVEILIVAVFWIAQTIDRWDDPAPRDPPRSDFPPAPPKGETDDALVVT